MSANEIADTYEFFWLPICIVAFWVLSMLVFSIGAVCRFVSKIVRRPR